MDTRLKALIDPDTVALIGASGNATRLTARPQLFMTKHGFAGRICPVNPGRDTVLDLPAWPSVGDIPGQVDHAYVLLDADPAIAAVEDCARAGVPVVSVLADGFAEAGAEGRARQDRIAAIARAAGMTLIGPNSMGVVNTETGFLCTTNAAFRAEDIPKGKLTVLSQSGSMIGALLSRGTVRGTTFGRLISLGNEAVTGVGEMGLRLVDDPGSEGFLLFLETIRDPGALAAFGRRAARLGKPVIAYMIGRSDEGQALAVSHTGALTGSATAVDAFLAANGIRRVDLFDTLLDAPRALIRTRRRPERPRTATVVTTTGGGGAMVVDQLSLRGVKIAGASPAARALLEPRGIPMGHGKLVDVTLAGAQYETMKDVVATLAADPQTGILVIATGSSAQFQPELAVSPVVDAVAGAGAGDAPVVAVPVPHAPESMAMLNAGGVPAFAGIEAAAETIALILDDREPDPLPEDPPPGPGIAAMLSPEAGLMDEEASGRVFAALGATLPRMAFIPEGEALPDTLPFGFPVVAKLVSPDLPHKTEAGAIRLNIGDRAALAAAIPDMIESAQAHAPGLHLRGVLVQEMTRGLGEALVGLTRDPLVGPVVTVAAGGTLAEVYRDATVRPAPVSLDTAREMVAAIKGFAPLRGYRGAPRGDLEALARLVRDVSRLAGLDRVQEAEINPVLIHAEGGGVTVLDALIRT